MARQCEDRFSIKPGFLILYARFQKPKDLIGGFREHVLPDVLPGLPSDELKRKSKLEQLRTRRLWEAIAQRITKPLALEDWRLITGRFLWEMQHDTQKKLFKILGWQAKRTSYGGLDFQTPAKAQIKTMSELELGRFLLLLCAIPEIEPSPYYQAKDSTLLALADRFGIDAAAIGTQVRAELDAKRKAKKKTEKQDHKKKQNKKNKPSKRTK